MIFDRLLIVLFLNLNLAFGCISIASPVEGKRFTPPYEAERFRPVLLKSKLQAPDSSVACKVEEMPNCAFEFFYLRTSDGVVVFEISGDKKRSELRQLEEWSSNSTIPKKLTGQVYLPKPHTAELTQFTFAQIHASGKQTNRPLLRLVWMKHKNDRSDGLWAVLRLSVEENQYRWSYLGDRTDAFFKFEIKVTKSILSVSLNDSEMLLADIAYWQHMNSYFKAGVYLQSMGTARAEYRSLSFVPAP